MASGAAPAVLPRQAEVVFKFLLFAAGTLCYALLGILSQLSKEQDGKYAYSPPSVALMAEVLKLLLSCGFLVAERGSLGTAVLEVASGGPWLWLSYTVPSLLYAMGNNLDMLNNLHMDPATEHVLVQGKIFTTGLLWWLVFRQPLGLRKWLSLLLLFGGGVLAALPSEALVEGSRRMHIDSVGVVFVMLHCWGSGGAGVYNEWLLKVLGGGRGESIHTSNIRLYIIGSMVNLAAFCWHRPGSDRPFLFGHNRYSLALVLTYALMGLVLSQVMKWFNVIVKLFMSGASMYVTAVFSWLLFGFAPTTNFALGLALVTFAMVLFNADKIQAAFAHEGKNKSQ